MFEDRMLCGWRVASAVPLPDLAVWQGEECPADLVISLGTVPEALENPVLKGILFQVAADGTTLLTLPLLGRFLISGGNRVVIETVRPPEPGELRVFLYGSVLSVLALQRGLLPLHASAVQMPRGALLLVGNSGVGKSSMATALARRGYPFLADDVAVIDPATAQGPRLLPGLSSAKLWQDSLDAFALESATLVRNRPSVNKFHLPLAPEGIGRERLPLRGIVLLHTPNGTRTPGFSSLAPQAKPSALLPHVKTSHVAARIESAGFRLKAMLQIAAAAEVIDYTRHSDFARIDEDVTALLDRFGGGQ